MIKPEDAEQFVNTIRLKAGEEIKPAHDDIVETLKDMGNILGFIVKLEEQTPDKAYRLDVTWRDFEGHRPLKVFEVELSGSIDLALARLTHALDIWGPEQLWLIVSDVKETERAKKLVEPRIKGSFARLRNKLEIIGWQDVIKAYKRVKESGDLIRKMAKR